MNETVIYVRAARDEVVKAIQHIPQEALSGSSVADAMMTRCGMTALGRIKRAFVTKARGGTDEAGEKWKPLSPVTIARRRHRTSPPPHMGTEILRDTGLLLNSLSPGIEPALNVFRVLPGVVIVGTNRKWAWTHHRGLPKRRIPQRRLWPSVDRWPSSWWLDILEQARQGLIDIAIQLIKRV
jgi:hypothetical protein